MPNEMYTPPLSALDYFEQRILPTDIRAVLRTETDESRFEQHMNETELLFVSDGSGTMTVNAGVYELQRGDMFCICPHHFHKLSAAAGSRLTVIECHMNGGMFLYIASCPYYHPSSISIPYAPFHVRFDEENSARIEAMMRRMIAEKRRNSQLSFYLVVRLFGLLERYSPHNQEPGAGEDI